MHGRPCTSAPAPTGPITISTNITLIGAGEDTSGTIINCWVNVVTIAAGTPDHPVTLRGLWIWHGNCGIGATPGRHLTLSDCTVSGNRGLREGAGILNRGGTLRVTGCTVENNTSASNSGGGLFNDAGQVTLTNCLF